MDRLVGAGARRRRGGGRGRARGAARVRRLARAPGLRGRAERRVRRADGRPALRGRRHQVHGPGHQGRHRRAAARGAAAAGGRDAAAGDHDVRVQVRVRPHGGRRGPVGGAGGRGHRRGDVPRRARGAPRVRRRRQRLRRPGPRADARGVRAVLALGGRVLRARRVRRGRGARRADGGHGARAAAADPREPAGYRARHPAGRGTGRCLRRPLHVPHGRRCGGARLIGHRGDPAARRRVRHQAAVPGRAPPAVRRGGGRPGHRLQSRILVHLEHAVLHRARGPRYADDHGGSGLVRDRGRRQGAAPHRRGLPGPRRPRRPDHAERPVARLPRLPPGRPAGPHRLAIRQPRFRGNAVTARRQPPAARGRSSPVPPAPQLTWVPPVCTQRSA